MANRIIPISSSDVVEETEVKGRNSILNDSSAIEYMKSYFSEATIQINNKFTIENFKKFCLWFLETGRCTISISFDDLMMMLTFFVLFASDIRTLTAPKSVDAGFEVAYSICLFFFITEFVLSIYAKTTIKSYKPLVLEGYFFSFFFWLDLIAIISMFPDIRWIANRTGIGNVAASVNSTNNNFSKAGRVVRTVRLARLVRLYKIQSERKRLARIEEEQMLLVRQGVITYEEVVKMRQLNQERNSKVGAELSDTITKRVIIIVLLMLCLVPILNYTAPDNTQHYAVRLLHDFNVHQNNQTKEVVLNDFMKYYAENGGQPYVIRLEMAPYIDGFYVNRKHYLNNLRNSEITKEVFHTYDNSTGIHYKTLVWFSAKYATNETALNGILLTIFVCFMMLAGTIVFTMDVEELVLKPIQRMMNMVEQVAKDPLSPVHFSHFSDDGKEIESHEYETRLLEDTIEKITGLLRVGFGEAGAGIISANLNLEDNSAVINPLIPGLRIYAIFGFCDIHHFEEINEKLGKDIMTFVNTIALVVHTSVHDWRGQSNKNLGQAFLVVWRIGDEQTLNEILHSNPVKPAAIAPPSSSNKHYGKKPKTNAIDLRRVPGVDILADSALIAYLKIIAELNRASGILKYREDTRLTYNGTHDFKVRMGFGLHAGWAIEGAVGSLQKVDATYLSPHVNMAARLETSSKQYGVPILMSQNVFDLMSDDGRKYCRRLDVITVKGSEVPIGIYTYDLNQNQFFLSPRKEKISGAGRGPRTVIPLRRANEPLFLTSAAETQDVFASDYDLVTLRHQFKPEFKTIFEEGLESYLQGEWITAKKYFERTNEIVSKIPTFENGDGPSNTLLKYMEAHGWQAPSSWKGFRPLTSK
mmetsp:Transcript_4336/g.4340  ORF Transcript_4336/g.4340 Transcript_4336/m.4340 type:complete len:869 (-) Transcript_4336:157-2763(-)